MQRSARLVVATSILLAAACGGGPGGASSYTGSCDFRTSLGICSEYDGQTPTDAAKLEADCDLVARWSSTDKCPRASIIGGCRAPHSLSGFITGWYYPGSGYATADDVRAACAMKNGMFLPP